MDIVTKAEEWTLKYAAPSKEELKLIKEMEGEKIELIIEIEEKDVNKDIYFINNKEDYFYDGVKELNKTNVSLLIDGKKQNFQNNFKFSKGKHKVILKFKNKIKNCYRMFKDCLNLIDIDLSLFDTSDVNNKEEMFSGCNNLTNLDLSSFFLQKM